jgi:HPr kinase/phosphorylase
MVARLTLHATAVAFDGRGVLITGASGSGKSGLALQLIAIGAALVADDQTELSADADGVHASCPAATAGLIEARGVGLLNAPHQASARLVLAVDLDQTEPDRLPPLREARYLGHPVSLVFSTRASHFAAALRLYALYGRWA